MDTIKPILSHYDYALWSGDKVTSVASKLRNLVKVWENGVRWDNTILMASERPLSDEENYEECCKAILVSPENQKADLAWKTINPKTESEMMNWVWFNFDDPTRGRHALGGPCQEFFLYKDPLMACKLPSEKPGSVLIPCSIPSETIGKETFWKELKSSGFTLESL